MNSDDPTFVITYPLQVNTALTNPSMEACQGKFRIWYDLFMKQPLPVVRRQSDSYYEFKREDWNENA